MVIAVRRGSRFSPGSRHLGGARSNSRRDALGDRFSFSSPSAASPASCANAGLATPLHNHILVVAQFNKCCRPALCRPFLRLIIWIARCRAEINEPLARSPSGPQLHRRQPHFLPSESWTRRHAGHQRIPRRLCGWNLGASLVPFISGASTLVFILHCFTRSWPAARRRQPLGRGCDDARMDMCVSIAAFALE